MENPLYRFNHKVKTSLKKALWPGSTLFEDMGFTYLGPIDGHDLDRLVHVLDWARELHVPGGGPCEDREGQGLSPSRSRTRTSSTAWGPSTRRRAL